MMPRKGQQAPGSTRAEGQASIGVSVPTREMLKKLAGRQPVSDYLKELAQQKLNESGSRQAAFVKGEAEKDDLKDGINAILEMRDLTKAQQAAINATWFGRIFSDEAIIGTVKEAFARIKGEKEIEPSVQMEFEKRGKAGV